ncbi:MAG: hypothetical protein JO278_03725, partial [Dyella sp.]|nr:hypothetical protein [Dyella sp.]MBV8270637.1 hypothetical protein [Cupriavidus sp.]
GSSPNPLHGRAVGHDRSTGNLAPLGVHGDKHIGVEGYEDHIGNICDEMIAVYFPAISVPSAEFRTVCPQNVDMTATVGEPKHHRLLL